MSLIGFAIAQLYFMLYLRGSQYKINSCGRYDVLRNFKQIRFCYFPLFRKSNHLELGENMPNSRVNLL